ncbi:polysaccharide biosynthesis protein [Sphingomonas gei]|uniref:polysaccharide biosynthesis protein n=1 Tax=Sphingomonas gei TaxID=1395960 RepID=UPI0019D0559A|nr:nucleoside-diphosphate sugar epimerase/dehydratase [Sphingomonas gei]
MWLAFYVRLDGPTRIEGPFVIAAVGAILLAAPVFYCLGLYRFILRYVTPTTTVALVQASFVFGLLYALIFSIMGVPGVPRTVGLLQPILFFVGAALWRSAVGYILGGAHRGNLRNRGVGTNVLIYGAGAAGQQLASAIALSRELRVVGFIDDNTDLHGRVLNRVRVHSTTDLANLTETLDVQEVLLAIPSASRSRRNEVIRSLFGLDVRVRTLPGLMDLAHGHVQVNDIKQLEIEDLLGRDVVTPNAILLGKDISDRTVMVTGAGGSIGSELCRQILKVRPAALLLIESNEYALYQIHQELLKTIAREDHEISLVPLLGSVRDERRMHEIIATWRPHTIYHAAAYKHVPLVEHNPVEGVQNNVIGTLTVAQVANELAVPKFVLISTDKAVRPTNVMGTSKRLAEMVLQSLADQNPTTCFTMVRFGNVLGSSGSVVPLFRQQLAEGGPITITHPDITRYFMTIPEAAQLVIQAGAMANGGEVFVLDMGEPVRIIDLARNMIEMSGLTLRDAAHPEGDIEIKVVGLRPGEKLYEELLIGDNPELTSHPRIMKANESFLRWGELGKCLATLSATLAANDVVQVQAILRRLVPEYLPTGAMVDWVMLRRNAD